MKKIILITSHFPYYPGEQFLETEVKYLDAGMYLTIMPLDTHKKRRILPSSAKLDHYCIDRKSTTFSKIYYLSKSIINLLFYKEFFNQVGVKIKRIKPFLSSMYAYQRYYDIFDNYFKDKKDLENIIVYTYWNTEVTYALQSLKKKYRYKLISRIHRYDIYKERRIDSYMPLKHLFTKNIDKVFTITQSANEYLVKNYGFNNEILELSRLGVDNYFIKSNSSLEDTFFIVSCSFLVDVKRIDKIIDALVILSKKLPLTKFEWSHIGSGPLEKTLKKLSEEKLIDKENVSFKFIGNLSNEKVYKFYEDNKVDVFINVSESEGVPVSIMEAMSCHIPIVAPNIGGISDMIIDNQSGKILSEKCEPDELAEALSDIEFFKNKLTREKTYEVYLEKYDAKKNYINFIETLKSM